MDKIHNPDTKSEQQEAPQSARDSIRAALDEHKEKLAKVEEKSALVKEPVEEKTEQKTSTKEVKEDKAVSDKVAAKSDVEEKITKEDTSTTEIKDSKEDKVEPVEPKSEAKTKVPFGLPKDIRAEWDKLSPNTQQYLSKVVKENLDNKALEGRKSHMREVEQVLTPYMPQIQQVGVSPAQVVKRLLDYTDALASPRHKYAAIQSLAANYGIDLSVFAAAQEDTSQNTQNNQPLKQTQNQNQNQNQQVYIPPEIDNKLNTILERFDQIDGSQRNANDKAALDFVNAWAGHDAASNEYTNKPYFPYVRQAMFNLISSGTVPMVNGQLDLDGAYDLACYADPKIRELIEEDRISAIRQEQINNQAKQQQAVQKAKLAGSSIRSGAPAPVNRQPNSNRSSMNGKPTTVRDSIRQALHESRNA